MKMHSDIGVLKGGIFKTFILFLTKIFICGKMGFSGIEILNQNHSTCYIYEAGDSRCVIFLHNLVLFFSLSLDL